MGLRIIGAWAQEPPYMGGDQVGFGPPRFCFCLCLGDAEIMMRRRGVNFL